MTEFTNTPRDIEWALVDGQVVLLQPGPMTSVFRKSDFEIQNDLNCALYTHREVLSRANLEYVRTSLQVVRLKALYFKALVFVYSR